MCKAVHGTTLGDVLRSGSHLKLIAMVASRETILAAIDRFGFSLARYAAPDDMPGVSFIGRTASHPGIAFVADGCLPEPIIKRLRATILAFREEPSWSEMQPLFGVSDITVLDPARYAPIASVAAEMRVVHRTVEGRQILRIAGQQFVI